MTSLLQMLLCPPTKKNDERALGGLTKFPEKLLNKAAWGTLVVGFFFWLIYLMRFN